jgi:alanyl-tRNA synthetase
LEKEEERFFRALETGTKLLEKKLQELAKQKKKQLDCNTAFDLYQSYGFPLEMIAEICKEKGFEVDSEGFGKCLLGHQEVSRKGAEQTFKGGLADTKEQTTRLHTATHLLHAALMEIVNKNIIQKGSNITAERLRFDFNSDERLSDEQLKKVGEWVNKAIQACADVNEDVLSVEEAKKKGAHGIFDSKYGEKVKVYTVTDGKKVYSKEICGGPHVKTVKGMGHFKILKQESVAAGVKRIKAVLE